MTEFKWNPHPKQKEFLDDDRLRVLYSGGQPHRSDSEWIRRLFVENSKLKKFITKGNGYDKEIWAVDVSDGYHTFTELYEHRITLFYALTKIYDNYITPLSTRVKCWKSKLHDDGTMYEGWFIAGMTVTEFTGPPLQIAYHIPIAWWDKFKLLELDKAPKYDGYTANDVLQRLMKL
jgi:hypothetical protein